LPPFIVTLGGLTALRGVAYLIANGTTVLNRNLNFAWIGNDYLGSFPFVHVIALLVVLASWFIAAKCSYGVN
jgi:ribose transport system permease protein